jgi:hypothetical protein
MLRLPPKSMSGIFGDLVQGRQDILREQHKWGVYPLTKKGKPMKIPSSTFITEDEAILAAEEMTILNDKPFIAKRL